MIGGLNIHYEKRKNIEFFRKVCEFCSFSEIQNYIPIYNKFFGLNEGNYNSINLNHPFFINNIEEKQHHSVYECTIKNINEASSEVKTDVFFKFAPLLDPYKFLSGKYNIHKSSLYTLPILSKDMKEDIVHPKLLDENNSSYIDSLFSFITSKLLHQYGFIHGVDFYGSFVGIQENFTMNVADDLEYLVQCDFFKKHKNEAFFIENYEHLIDTNFDDDASKTSQPSLVPIHIENQSIPMEINDIQDSKEWNDINDLFDSTTTTTTTTTSMELIDIMNEEFEINTNNVTTLHSLSTCSSRTSITEEEEEEVEGDDEEQWETDDDEKETLSKNEEEDEIPVMVTIPRFPVNLICMEKCDYTFDHLIITNKLSEKEWMSTLMQIIMILVTYQKCFSLTHNDLHTNNIMYTHTEKKYIYYIHKKKQYKVPTYGRIFKIIDYGRAIFKYDSNLFCSDSFQHGADASQQYNTEPYLNDKKPRLEPNFSFDLCRLACSIFDYLVDDLDEIKDIELCEPIVRIITEWCMDDNGIHMLYKKDYTERYPDFKLYKMIARCVHKHTPEAQLKRKEFEAFVTKKIPLLQEDIFIINIDDIPCFYKP